MENLSEGKSGCHATAGKSAAWNWSQTRFEKKIPMPADASEVFLDFASSAEFLVIFK